MITIVIPTRNRGYTLAKVADSYYAQIHVNEIIFVDDCGDDNTYEVVSAIAANYPKIDTRYIRHTKRKGAAGGRITGYDNATNQYILFCDDDEYLEENYTAICLSKLLASPDIGIVSGRRIYKEYNESNLDAKNRFGSGTENISPFNFIMFGFNDNAIFEGDLDLPLTNSIILTKKKLLQEYSYDSFYSKGNGYREESDFQMNLFVNGFRIVVTNDTHSFHLSRKEAQIGGQRTNRIQQLFWNVYYTNYFFNKYYVLAKQKIGIRTPKNLAIARFFIVQFYILFLRPMPKISNYILRRLSNEDRLDY